MACWSIMVGPPRPFTSHAASLPADSRPWPLALCTQEPESLSVYLNQIKLGCHSYQFLPSPTGFMLKERTFLRFSIFGRPQTILMRTECRLNHDLSLKSFLFLMDADPTHYELTGEVSPDGIRLHRLSLRQKSETLVPCIEKPYFASCIPAYLASQGFKLGTEGRFTVFDPMSGLLLSVRTVVESPQFLDTPRFSGQVYVVRMEHGYLEMKFYVDSAGRVHREESLPGLVMVRDDAEAPCSENDRRNPPEDIARLSRIPFSGRIQNPRQCDYLKLRVQGIDTSAFNLGTERQKISGEILEIQRENLSHLAPYEIPYREGRYLDYLVSTPFIQSDDPEIRSLALKILGGAKDAKTAACLLTEWVFENIEKTPLISNPNALEILKQRKGDCNEHAVLLAALLRSAGIPARLCTGLVYLNDGFYFHAWNEAYVGEWISLDAAFNQAPTDATHIRLLEGDLENQMRLMRVIGRLKLEIIRSHSPDSSE
jgi:hypothetical protein